MDRSQTSIRFSPHLFWDIDDMRIDVKKLKPFIIQRVLEYGLMEDWRLIKKIYGLEEIKKEALNFRSLDAVTLSFLSSFFHLKKQDFRCYKFRQSAPNFWDY